MITPEQKRFIETSFSVLGPLGCAKHLGINFKRVSHYAYQLGLKVSPECRGKICETAHEKPNNAYKVNADGFINVQTPEHAYILGLIWADGWVGRTGTSHAIECSMVQEDFDQLLPVLMKTGNWNVYRLQRKPWKPIARMNTSNRPLREYLSSKGYESKSGLSACKILDAVPDHLKHYWFRGLFDGDGYMGHSMNISSVYDQDWTYLEKLAVTLGIKCSIYRRVNQLGQKCSMFVTTNMGSAALFGEYIYQGFDHDRIGLSRKHENWLKVRAAHREREIRLNKRFVFRNQLTKAQFTGTKTECISHFQTSFNNVGRAINGDRKSVKGWKLIEIISEEGSQPPPLCQERRA